MEIKGFTKGELKVSDFDLQMKDPLRITFETASKNWLITDNAFLTSSLQIQKGVNEFESSGLTCRFSGLTESFAANGLSADFEVSTVVVGNNKQSLPLKDLSGRVKLEKNTISGNLQFASQEVTGKMGLSFDHDLKTAAGKFKLNMDEKIELSLENSLSNIVSSWEYPFDLESGEILLVAEGSWDSLGLCNLSSFVNISGIGGYYKQLLFDGLDYKQDLVVLPELHSQSEGRFFLQHFTGGIDVYDTSGSVTLNVSKMGKFPIVELNDFSASLLGGSIRVPDISYDVNQPDSHFVAEIDSMELESLVELIKMETLQVTGTISGSIPVDIKGKTITVSHGELNSDEPGGEIHYFSETTEQSGAAGYALRAIENLQYRTLSVKTEYEPTGDLNLDISLQGTSPELHSTRPVHLNIHAEQNLLELLQSLRFSKGLTEELDKRVKQHYN